MRIHSKFQDYYDGNIAQFRDETINWVRKPSSIKVKIPKQIKDVLLNCSNRATVKEDGREWRVESWINVVGMCGKFYPYIRSTFSEVGIVRDYSLPVRLDDFRYTDSEILGVYDIHYPDNDKFSKYRAMIESGDRNSLVHALEVLRTYTNDDIFMDHNTPIITFAKDSIHRNGYSVETNSNLEDRKFGRCMNGWEVMQNISMYYASILTSTPDIKEFDDKTKIQQHGFDVKKSFRKEKTKNRK